MPRARRPLPPGLGVLPRSFLSVLAGLGPEVTLRPCCVRAHETFFVPDSGFVSSGLVGSSAQASPREQRGKRVWGGCAFVVRGPVQQQRRYILPPRVLSRWPVWPWGPQSRSGPRGTRAAPLHVGSQPRGGHGEGAACLPGWPSWSCIIACVAVRTHTDTHARLKEQHSSTGPPSWRPCGPLLAASLPEGEALRLSSGPVGLPASFPLCTEDSFSTTQEGGRSQSSPHLHDPGTP